MNNKGQTIMMGVMLGLMVFLFGILFISFIGNLAESTRGVSNLDCDNSAISDGAKLACLQTEIVVPYLIGFIIATAGGLIIARFVI